MYVYNWPYLYVNKIGNQQYQLFIWVPAELGKQIKKVSPLVPNYDTKLNTLLIEMESVQPAAGAPNDYLHEYLVLQPKTLGGVFDPREYGIEVSVKIIDGNQTIINKFGITYEEADQQAQIVTNNKVALNCPYMHLKNLTSNNYAPYCLLWLDNNTVVAAEQAFPVANSVFESVLLLRPRVAGDAQSNAPFQPAFNGGSYPQNGNPLPGFFKPWIAEVPNNPTAQQFMALPDPGKKTELNKPNSQYFSGPPKSAKKSNATSHSNPNIFVDDF